MKRIRLFHLIFGMFVIAGCAQAPSLSTPGSAEPQAATAMPLPTATSETLPPAGWVTHSAGQQCKYSISFPSEMEFADQSPYSQTFRFKSANPEEGARNFIYISMITPEIQNMVKQGTYNSDVYNYVPADSDILLKMQVGESKALHEELNVASGFTYQRQPDTMFGEHIAQAYENIQPWEFPAGTKEIRYYISSNGCTYLIGGYLDTTASSQPGAIVEDIFHQIMGTVQLMP